MQINVHADDSNLHSNQEAVRILFAYYYFVKEVKSFFKLSHSL